MKRTLVALVLIGLLITAEMAYAGRVYKILVDFSEFELTLFDGQGKELVAFPVALPEFIPRNLPIKGRVTKIERSPYWYPTQKTRQDYFQEKKRELPSIVKPKDPGNAMGVAKIIVVFETICTHPTIRIHGTNTPGSIGKRVTRGCIRLRNQDILALINFIGKEPTMVLFEK